MTNPLAVAVIIVVLCTLASVVVATSARDAAPKCIVLAVVCGALVGLVLDALFTPLPLHPVLTGIAILAAVAFLLKTGAWIGRLSFKLRFPFGLHRRRP